MNLADFRHALAHHPGCGLRFIPSDGAAIADHFHVTEVGCVEKQFVDCGGVRRRVVACVLQTLVAHDTEHRLTTDKLAGVMGMADVLNVPSGAPVEVEHQERSVSIDAVDGFELVKGPGGDVVEFRLAAKQTACLAEDACGMAEAPGAEGLDLLTGGDCCGAPGSC